MSTIRSVVLVVFRLTGLALLFYGGMWLMPISCIVLLVAVPVRNSFARYLVESLANFAALYGFWP